MMSGLPALPRRNGTPAGLRSDDVVMRGTYASLPATTNPRHAVHEPPELGKLQRQNAVRRKGNPAPELPPRNADRSPASTAARLDEENPYQTPWEQGPAAKLLQDRGKVPSRSGKA